VVGDVALAAVERDRELADGRRVLAEREQQALPERVTGDLQAVNGDQHLRLKHHADEIADQPDEAGLVAAMSRQADLAMGASAGSSGWPATSAIWT
jgi:hypothetical protein